MKATKRWVGLLGLLLGLLLGCGGGPCPDGEAAGGAAAASGGERGGGERAQAHAHAHAGQGGHGGHHHTHRHDGPVQHSFADVQRWVERFEAPERASWQRPVEVVGLLGLRPGATVADLGAGTGYFLPLLSVAVGPQGKVLGLDVEPNMVAYMRERAEREGLANVEARQVPADGPGLPPGSVDAVLVVDTWHHLPERARYAAALREALRPGGVVLVVDFTAESPIGPPPEHRIAPEQVIEELRAGGLEAELVPESLPHQYVVRARRP